MLVNPAKYFTYVSFIAINVVFVFVQVAVAFLYRSDILLAIAVMLPFFSATLIYALRRVPRSQEVVSLSSSLLLLPVLYRLYTLLSATQSHVSISYELTRLLHIVFAPEALGMVFCLLVSLLWIVTNIYTIGFMHVTDGGRKNRCAFYACFSCSIGSTVCIALSGNIATLFIFYELLTVCTYPLIIYGTSSTSISAGSFYLRMLLCSSVLLFLPAVVIICSISDTTGVFTANGFVSDIHPQILTLLIAMLCYGIAKAAFFPNHSWLPRAMVAPTPVSALLHAVAVVKSGVFALAKITAYCLGINGLFSYYYTNVSGSASILQHNILLYVSAVTVIFGSVMAVRQNNLKKLLAYSTISQLSYITLSISMFTDGALKAAMMQMVCHAFTKITLFFSVGALYAATKKANIKDIDGLGRALPITFGAFSIGALSMIGIPPAPTFWSKFFIVSEAVKHDNLIVIVTVILSTFLNTMYFVPVLYRAFFCSPAPTTVSKIPLSVNLAMVITSTCAIVLFLKPSIVLDILASMGFK